MRAYETWNRVWAPRKSEKRPHYFDLATRFACPSDDPMKFHALLTFDSLTRSFAATRLMATPMGRPDFCTASRVSSWSRSITISITWFMRLVLGAPPRNLFSMRARSRGIPSIRYLLRPSRRNITEARSARFSFLHLNTCARAPKHVRNSACAASASPPSARFRRSFLTCSCNRSGSSANFILPMDSVYWASRESLFVLVCSG